jgi:hypothetical protein
MSSDTKIFDSLVDAKLYHLTEQMTSDVLLVPVYQVLTDSVPGCNNKLVPNGKIQYFHKRSFVKNTRTITICRNAYPHKLTLIRFGAEITIKIEHCNNTYIETYTLSSEDLSNLNSLLRGL